MHQIRKIARHHRTALVLAAIIVLAVCVALLLRVQIVDVYEDISYSIAPSAAKAFAYGELHFNAQNPSFYDFARARYYFTQAVEQDPTYPYAYHELARVYFLEDKLPQALEMINEQILYHGDTEANSYYVRGLIEGYMGQYTAAEKDYAHFLQFDPLNWAGLNDYAWVLLKDNKPQEAAAVTTKGLGAFPDNAWLLNSNAIALYEAGDLAQAKIQAQKAIAATSQVSDTAWLHAYPGNDPSVAAEGIASLKSAAQQNLQKILAATSSPVR